MTPGAANLQCAYALFETLSHLGVLKAFVSPGSRSAPLTIALGRSPAFEKYVILDERAAAFAALGAAKATDQPSVLVCTSGTAGANYVPAVWEASLSRTPLLVITADRPPEQQYCGAAQTMPQQMLFTNAAVAQYTTPVPECSEHARVFRSLAARAWHSAVNLRGPVHINVPMREPLLPAGPFSPTATRPLEVNQAAPMLPLENVERLRQRLRSASRIAVVCGPTHSPVHALIPWAESFGAPVFADIASGLRFGSAANATITGYHGVLQAWPQSVGTPQIVLRFGGLPTSKPLQRWLDNSGAYQVVIGESPWSDAAHTADDVYAVPASVFIESIGYGKGERPQYRNAWQRVDEQMRLAIEGLLAQSTQKEARIGAELASLLQDRDLLFLSNSMPIRYADMFCPPTSKDVRVLANRGVNGIDGILSTAAGAAAALKRRLLLVVGDLAFQHDVGGLAVARELGIQGKIVVVNNAGGAIFSHLPVKFEHDVFVRYFTTPQNISIEACAKAFGIDYLCVDRSSKLVEACSGSNELQIIEFRVDNPNAGDLEALWNQLAKVQTIAQPKAQRI